MLGKWRWDERQGWINDAPRILSPLLDLDDLDNMCPAGKHDLNVVGLAPAPSRHGPEECRGCIAERMRLMRQRRRGANVPIDPGYGGTRHKFAEAVKSWMEYGLCRDPSVDTELFWPQEGESDDETAVRYAKAKQVCADCFFKDECLTYAVENDEQIGVWGGTTPEERPEHVKPVRPVLTATNEGRTSVATNADQWHVPLATRPYLSSENL